MQVKAAADWPINLPSPEGFPFWDHQNLEYRGKEKLVSKGVKKSVYQITNKASGKA